MAKLTEEQRKTLEDVFASYPEDFKSYRYGTMEGIQEQLNELGDKVGVIWYVKDANDKYDLKINKFIVNVK